MDYKVFKNENFNIGKWSGGETKETAIFPEEADYIRRNFIWRLSSASIETEESQFTSLPDYDRILMVLEGDVVLAYEGERVARLRSLEQDRFDGAFQTKSFGKIKDYNLMIRKGAHGILDSISLTEERAELELDAHENCSNISQGLYCHQGYAVISIGAETCMLSEGEQFVINYQENETLSLGVMGEGSVIRAQIFYDDMSLGPEKIPDQDATLADLKEAAKISMTNFRGSQSIFRYLQDIWYDEELKRCIQKIERFYLPTFIWFAGLITIMLTVAQKWEPNQLGILIVCWSIIMYAVISPLLYFVALPKPVKAHIKRMDSLTDYEQGVVAKELSANPRAEKILKRYKITARNVYLPDKQKKKTNKIDHKK